MLKDLYENTIKGKLLESFKYDNVMEVPKLTKIVLNVGHGVVDKALSDSIFNHMMIISGQCPVVTKAKKSISNFKVREGMIIGCRVTLRAERMYYFLERLIFIALPRSRDFHGLNPRSFDGAGNFSFGISEQIIFPELGYVDTNRIFGMDITLCTNTRDNQSAKSLLSLLGLPFIEN